MKMTKMMQALVLDEYGKPFNLREIPVPEIGENEILVKIHSSGVNPLDLKIYSGQAAHAQVNPPAILGIDMAGVVEVIGSKVEKFAPGDEVFGMTGGVGGVQGSLAEYAAVDSELLSLKPRNLSLREAAAMPLVCITAWEALIDRANVRAGKTVLIHGGAGGVGHIAIQIAKAKDAQVYATGNAENAALISKYGALPIDYNSVSVEEYISQHTNGEGFDIILDTVGGKTLDDSFTAVKRYTGHVVSILGWGAHNLAPLSFRGATYSGVFTLYPLLSGKGRAHHGEILKEIKTLAETGKLFLRVDAVRYNLKTIDQAYRAAHTTREKIVVDI